MSMFDNIARALGFGNIIAAGDTFLDAIGITQHNAPPGSGPSLPNILTSSSALAQAVIPTVIQTAGNPTVTIDNAINILTNELATLAKANLGVGGTVGADVLLAMAPDLETLVNKYLPAPPPAAV